MQQTGGGVSGPIGRRSAGSLARLIKERQQQQPPQLNPQTAANAMLHQTKPQVGSDRGLLDILATPGNKTIELGSNLYHGADEFVRNLLPSIGRTADAAFSGEMGTPMDIAEDVGQSYLDYYSDPAAIWQDPFRLAMDVAGAAGGAAGLEGHLSTLDDLAMTAKLGVTPSMGDVAMANDLRAITPFGKKLEALATSGDEVSGVRNATIGWGDDSPGIVPSAEEFTSAAGSRNFRPRSSANAPNFGMADVGDDTGLAILKPGAEESKWQMDQSSGELFYQDLNRGIAERLGYDPVRMPGAARADFDYVPVQTKQRYPGMYESSVPTEMHPTNGLAIEYVPGARDVAKGELTTPMSTVSPEDVAAMKRTMVMDFLAANTDRDFATGHNVMRDPEGLLAIDHGLSGRDTTDFYMDPGPGVVPPGWGGSGPAGSQLWMGAEMSPSQWPGYKLEPEHVSILEQGLDYLRSIENDPNSVPFQEMGLEGIEGAIARAENALQRGSLFAEHPFVQQSGQAQAAFHPNGMQALADALAAEVGTNSQGWEPPSLDFNSDFASDVPHLTKAQRMNAFDDIEQPGEIPPAAPARGLLEELNAALDAFRERGLL